MLLKRYEINNFKKLVFDIKNSNKMVPVRAKCILIKILITCKKEIDKTTELISDIVCKYGEKNENGELNIAEDNSISVGVAAQNEINSVLNDVVNIDIPSECKLTTEQLIEMELDWDEIEILLPFIKI